ncbi:hypothetical protein [Streptomyces siamensis]|uniref:Transcriptional regulator n=1 Tax=Streptomyces siamensis TaxID=1274986 RepID=A0ABP9J1H0_9ACTN
MERVRRALNRLADIDLARHGPLGQYRPMRPEAAGADLLSRRRLEAGKGFAGVHAAVSDLTDQCRAGRLIGGAYDTVAVPHPAGLLDALLELYLAYWERAQPCRDSSSHAESDAPTQEELMLLEMLKASFKDQTIARRLGRSSRTASRRMTVLMNV